MERKKINSHNNLLLLSLTSFLMYERRATSFHRNEHENKWGKSGGKDESLKNKNGKSIG